MDPQHTFLRVHARLSRMLAQLLTPRNRSSLEYASLRVPIVLLGVLTVMHVNFVAQLGCANEFPGSTIDESQLVQIKEFSIHWRNLQESTLLLNLIGEIEIQSSSNFKWSIKKNRNNSIGNKMREENLIPHPTFIGLIVLKFNGCLWKILGELSLEGLLKNGISFITGRTNYVWGEDIL